MKPIKLDTPTIDKILAEVKAQLEAGRNYKTTTFKLNSASEKPANRPVIDFDAIAWLKIQKLVQICTTECAWQGTVTASDDHMYYQITDVMCYPQTIAAATVVTDEEKYEAWHQKLDNDTYNALRLQGHSHVTFSATPSSTDSVMYEKMLETLSTDSFYIFMIINKSDKTWFEIHDLPNNVIYENTDIDILINGINLNSWCKEQYDMFTRPKAAWDRIGTTGTTGATGAIYTASERAKMQNEKTTAKAKTKEKEKDEPIGFNDEPPYGCTQAQYADPFYYKDDSERFSR